MKKAISFLPSALLWMYRFETSLALLRNGGM